MAGPQRTPPRFVPTLTAIVDSPASAQAELPDPVDAQTFQSEAPLSSLTVEGADRTREQRLGDAISAAVRQQLDAVLPRLREEIEQVVRLAIVDALEHEHSGNTGSVPSQTHRSLG